jgi:hypothetical protein
VPGPEHSSKEHEEVQLVRLEDLHVEEGAAAAVESEHLVGFLVEDHTGWAAVDVVVEWNSWARGHRVLKVEVWV